MSRSRDIFGTSSLVSVLKVCLGLVSVLRVQRLGLEDITSRSVSGFVTLGLVNIGAMHQAFGYIRKKIIDLKTNYETRKKQVSGLTSFKCDSALFSLLSKRT